MADDGELTEAEIGEVLAMEKFMVSNLVWAEKPNNTNFLHAQSLLANADGVVLQGLSVHLCVRVGRFAPDCLWDFGLFRFKGGKQLRLYQINVAPADKVTHNAREGAWYGPHQHFGASRVEKLDGNPPAPCVSHEAWFKEFLVRAKIQFGGKYEMPPIQYTLGDI